MQRAVLVLVVAAALVALALADGKASSVPCGVVFDGAKKADIDLQRSKELIAAHWFDFEDGLERNRVLRYEWAVISEALVTPAIKAGECRTAPGFRGVPDILDWESVGTHTSAKARVSLEDEVTYFVIVRATTSMGRQVYANSDGVTVSQRTSKPAAAAAAAAEPIAEPAAASAAKRSVEAAPVYGSGNPLIANGLLLDWNTYCPIDAANRCQQSQKTVGQFLSEQYGPPEFNQNSQSTQVFRTVPPELLVMSSSSSSSRPNGLNFGSIIGIAFGVMGFCVLASCLLILVSSFKSKSDKFKTNINRREEMEEF